MRPNRHGRAATPGAPISKMIVAAAVLLTAAGFTGCGSKTEEAPGPAVAEMGNTINDGTFGATETRNCADGKSLNIGGSQNTFTVTGRCDSVIVGGDDNQISFESVDKELIVAGLNNTITYQDGDPEVQDLGEGNTITKS